MSGVYLINQATFQQYEDISINIKPARIQSFIKKAQELDLKLFLGYAFYYDLVKQCNEDGTLKASAAAAYAKLLNGCEYDNQNGQLIIYDGLAPALVYFTLSRFIENDAIRYTNSGPVVKTLDNARPLAYADIIKMAQQYRSIANAHLNDVERFLYDNKGDYPLWNHSSRTKTSLQPGPRIRAVDRTELNDLYDDLNYNLNYLTNGY